MKHTQEQLVNYLKNYGFVFQSSEIYNGLANAWDYGPLGVLLKNNIKSLWWREFVTKQSNVVGLDSSIILNPRVWKASGHLSNFSDPLIDCKKCKARFRADKLISEQCSDITVGDNTSFEELMNIIKNNNITCPVCGSTDWTDIRKFNLMFKTFQGVTEDSAATLYLRPETAQGIFINFANVQRTARMKVPFGIGQIGKAFRNEITPGNFIFRTREFEQMELEYFCVPNESDKDFETWLKRIENFLFNTIQLSKDNIKIYEHPKDDLSHYSKRTVDFEFNFPHGFGELWGIANRTDFDLCSHMNESKANLMYLDPKTNEKYIPYVIEPSVGVERLFYAIISNFYEVEQLENDSREVLRLPFDLAPYKVAVLPLTNKLNEQTKEVFDKLLNASISTTFDTSGSIGKRYRRQDAIGTPICVTFDFDSLEKQDVTIRHRDSMKQERIKISDLTKYIQEYASK